MDKVALRRSPAIRRATARDAEAIARLSDELGYPSNPGIMRVRVAKILASQTDLLLVAVDESDAAVGWIQAHSAQLIESGFRVEIVGLIISRTVRRAGFGRALVVEVERWAMGLGAGSIVVRSNVLRAESHAFYPAIGYRASKTQQVYRKVLLAPGDE